MTVGIQAYDQAGNMVFDSNNMRVLRYLGLRSPLRVTYKGQVQSPNFYYSGLVHYWLVEFEGWDVTNTFISYANQQGKYKEFFQAPDGIRVYSKTKSATAIADLTSFFTNVQVYRF